MNSTKIVTAEGLRDVLGSLFAGIEDKNKEGYRRVAEMPEVQEAAASVRRGDLDAFFFSLVYPFENLINGLLAVEFPDSHEAQFLFKHSRFVENHFEQIIRKYEGSACCADKSGAILSYLLAFLRTGKEISFDYTQEYTFHLPKKVFTTHEEITTFFKALQRLHSGSPDSYIVALGGIMARQAALSAPAAP